MFKYSISIAGLTSSISAASSIETSTVQSAVEENSWFITKTSSESCAFTASNTATESLKMNSCISVGGGKYRFYECQTYSISGLFEIQLRRTEFTDAKCSKEADSLPTEVYATTCSEDTGFQLYSCSNSPDKGFEGQVLKSTYSSQNSCTSLTDYNRLNALSTGCSNTDSGSNTFSCSTGKTSFANPGCSLKTLTEPLSTLPNCNNVDTNTAYYSAYSCVGNPTGEPSAEPSGKPSRNPTENPTVDPTGQPSGEPTVDTSDDSFCFHVESKINYKGVEFTYEELKAGKEPECTVPHSPSSKGIIVSTSCGKTVRVTDTHLLATTKGFQLAYSLKVDDVLFGDYDKELCIVESVEKEKALQQYFGLNCVHSEVLVSGIRASTFGDFHTLPAWYMTYVGGLLGTETASSVGEYVAEWYFKK